MDSFFSSSSTSSPDTRTSSREGTINRYFDKDLFSSHDVMEMFRNTSDAVNEEPCQEFLTKLGVLLEDSPPEDVIPKYKQLVFKFIREMVNMKNFNSLELYLPNIMQYTQQLYTFNSLMETEMGVNDYFKFVSILVLEYLKTHFYPCTIIGGDKEQGVMYVVLTYLYRNEGAIMDVLFQLTFWLENSLAKSHIHAENLFNLIRKLFNSLIVQSRHYLSARHTNLSIINYIRVLLLFKVLKHLETECNVANASDVTIDFSIDSGIELVVLGLPIHRNLEPVLGLLGRVFPETKMSLFRGKMRQFLTTEDYYIFERIVGLLDFVQLHTESIDLKGNFNLKPMQGVICKVSHKNLIKLKNEPILRTFNPVNTEPSIKKNCTSRTFRRHAKPQPPRTSPRVAIEDEKQLLMTSNCEETLLVCSVLKNNRLNDISTLAENLVKSSVCDITEKHFKMRPPPQHEDVINRMDPNFTTPSPKNLVKPPGNMFGSAPAINKIFGDFSHSSGDLFSNYSSLNNVGQSNPVDQVSSGIMSLVLKDVIRPSRLAGIVKASNPWSRDSTPSPSRIRPKCFKHLASPNVLNNMNASWQELDTSNVSRGSVNLFMSSPLSNSSVQLPNVSQHNFTTGLQRNFTPALQPNFTPALQPNFTTGLQPNFTTGLQRNFTTALQRNSLTSPKAPNSSIAKSVSSIAESVSLKAKSSTINGSGNSEKSAAIEQLHQNSVTSSKAPNSSIAKTVSSIAESVSLNAKSSTITGSGNAEKSAAVEQLHQNSVTSLKAQNSSIAKSVSSIAESVSLKAKVSTLSGSGHAEKSGAIEPSGIRTVSISDNINNLIQCSSSDNLFLSLISSVNVTANDKDNTAIASNAPTSEAVIDDRSEANVPESTASHTLKEETNTNIDKTEGTSIHVTHTSIPESISVITELPNIVSGTPVPPNSREILATDLRNNSSTDLSNNVSTDLSNSICTHLGNNSCIDLSNNTSTDLINVSTDLSNNASSDLSNNLSTYVSNHASTNLPNIASTDLPNNAFTDFHNGVPTDLRNYVSTAPTSPNSNVSLDDAEELVVVEEVEEIVVFDGIGVEDLQSNIGGEGHQSNISEDQSNASSIGEHDYAYKRGRNEVVNEPIEQAELAREKSNTKSDPRSVSSPEQNHETIPLRENSSKIVLEKELEDGNALLESSTKSRETGQSHYSLDREDIGRSQVSNCNKHAAASIEDQNESVDTDKESYKPREYNGRSSLVNSMLGNSDCASVENIVNQIVQVAENLAKTDTRSDELEPFCTTTTLLEQDDKNGFAEIEPDDLVAHFPRETIVPVKFNGRNVAHHLEVKHAGEGNAVRNTEVDRNIDDNVPAILTTKPIIQPEEETYGVISAIDSAEQMNENEPATAEKEVEIPLPIERDSTMNRDNEGNRSVIHALNILEGPSKETSINESHLDEKTTHEEEFARTDPVPREELNVEMQEQIDIMSHPVLNYNEVNEHNFGVVNCDENKGENYQSNDLEKDECHYPITDDRIDLRHDQEATKENYLRTTEVICSTKQKLETNIDEPHDFRTGESWCADSTEKHVRNEDGAEIENIDIMTSVSDHMEEAKENDRITGTKVQDSNSENRITTIKVPDSNSEIETGKPDEQISKLALNKCPESAEEKPIKTYKIRPRSRLSKKSEVVEQKPVHTMNEEQLPERLNGAFIHEDRSIPDKTIPLDSHEFMDKENEDFGKLYYSDGEIAESTNLESPDFSQTINNLSTGEKIFEVIVHSKASIDEDTNELNTTDYTKTVEEQNKNIQLKENVEVEVDDDIVDNEDNFTPIEDIEEFTVPINKSNSFELFEKLKVKDDRNRNTLNNKLDNSNVVHPSISTTSKYNKADYEFPLEKIMKPRDINSREMDDSMDSMTCLNFAVPTEISSLNFEKCLEKSIVVDKDVTKRRRSSVRARNKIFDDKNWESTEQKLNELKSKMKREKMNKFANYQSRIQITPSTTIFNSSFIIESPVDIKRKSNMHRINREIDASVIKPSADKKHLETRNTSTNHFVAENSGKISREISFQVNDVLSIDERNLENTSNRKSYANNPSCLEETGHDSESEDERKSVGAAKSKSVDADGLADQIETNEEYNANDSSVFANKTLENQLSGKPAKRPYRRKSVTTAQNKSFDADELAGVNENIKKRDHENKTTVFAIDPLQNTLSGKPAKRPYGRKNINANIATLKIETKDTNSANENLVFNVNPTRNEVLEKPAKRPFRRKTINVNIATPTIEAQDTNSANLSSVININPSRNEVLEKPARRPYRRKNMHVNIATPTTDTQDTKFVTISSVININPTSNKVLETPAKRTYRRKSISDKEEMIDRNSAYSNKGNDSKDSVSSSNAIVKQPLEKSARRPYKRKSVDTKRNTLDTNDFTHTLKTNVANDVDGDDGIFIINQTACQAFDTTVKNFNKKDILERKSLDTTNLSSPLQNSFDESGSNDRLVFNIPPRSCEALEMMVNNVSKKDSKDRKSAALKHSIETFSESNFDNRLELNIPTTSDALEKPCDKSFDSPKSSKLSGNGVKLKSTERKIHKRPHEEDAEGAKKRWRMFKKKESNAKEEKQPETETLDFQSIEVTAEIHNEPEVTPSSKYSDLKIIRLKDLSSLLEIDEPICKKKRKEIEKEEKMLDEIRVEIEQEQEQTVNKKSNYDREITECVEPVKKKRGRPPKSKIESNTSHLNTVSTSDTNMQATNHFLWETSRKSKRKRKALESKLNVSIELDDRVRSIVSSTEQLKKSEFFRLNSQYETEDTCTDLPDARVPPIIMKHHSYQSFQIQKPSPASDDKGTSSMFESHNDKKRKSVDSESVIPPPLLSFESFDRSENEEDSCESSLFPTHAKDRRTSTLSTPRNSVDDNLDENSEDETVETIEKFISTTICSKESNETDIGKKQSIESNVNHEIHLNPNTNLSHESTLNTKTNFSPEVHLNPGIHFNPKTNISPEINLNPNTSLSSEVHLNSEIHLNPETNLNSKIHLSPEINSSPKATYLNTKINSNPSLSPEVHLNPEKKLNPKVHLSPKTNLNPETILNPEINLNPDTCNTNNEEVEEISHDETTENQAREKQSETNAIEPTRHLEKNTPEATLVSNEFNANFDQAYLSSPVQGAGTKDLIDNSDIQSVIQARDVNFNSSQYNCNMTEDTLLSPLEQNSVDLEASTESYTSSEWNMSSDNSMPSYLSYYEYNNTMEYSNSLKQVDKAETFTNFNVNEPTEHHRVEDKGSSEPDIGKKTESEKLRTYYENFTVSERSTRQCEEETHAKSMDSNKTQGKYPQTHATIFHLAKSSIFDKNSTHSQSTSVVKKNTSRKHKISGNYNSYNETVELNQKTPPYLTLADLKSDLVENSLSELFCDVNDKISHNDAFINTAALLGTDDKLFEESSSSEVSCNENLNQIIASLSDDTNSSDASRKKNEKISPKLENDGKRNMKTHSWQKSNNLENGFTIEGTNSTNSRLQFNIELGLEMMDNSELRIVKSSVRSKSSNPMDNSYTQSKSHIKTELDMTNTQVPNTCDQNQQTYARHHPTQATQHIHQDKKQHLQKHEHHEQRKSQYELTHHQQQQNHQQYQQQQHQQLTHQQQQQQQQQQQNHQQYQQEIRQPKSSTESVPWIIHNYDQTNANWKRTEPQYNQVEPRCTSQYMIAQTQTRNSQSFSHRPVEQSHHYVHQKTHQQIYNTSLDPTASPSKTTRSYSNKRYPPYATSTPMNPMEKHQVRTFSALKNHRTQREKSLLKTVHRKKLLEKQICQDTSAGYTKTASHHAPVQDMNMEGHHLTPHEQSIELRDSRYSEHTHQHIVINPQALEQQSTIRFQSIIMKTNNIVQTEEQTYRKLDSEQQTSRISRTQDITTTEQTIGPFITDHTFATDYSAIYTTNEAVSYLPNAESEGTSALSTFYYYEPVSYDCAGKKRVSSVLDTPIPPANRMMSIAEVLANPDCNPELQNKLKTISSSKLK